MFSGFQKIKYSAVNYPTSNTNSTFLKLMFSGFQKIKYSAVNYTTSNTNSTFLKLMFSGFQKENILQSIIPLEIPILHF